MTTSTDEYVQKIVPGIQGKTVLITGPSEGGVGAQTAIFLATGKPKLILLAGRSKHRIQPVIDEIGTESPDVSVRFVYLDLASQASIREAAKDIEAQVSTLDVLINNAGIMAVKDYTVTKEDVEMQLGVNHLGHFLLTNLLMQKILAADRGARIINVSSLGHLCSGVREDWNFKKEAYNPWLAYGQSKSANILFASSLARKLKSKGVLAFSLNPGFVPESRLQDEVTPEMFAEGYAITLKALNGDPMPTLKPISLAEGSLTTLYAAMDPTLSEHSGAFLSDGAIFTGLRDHVVGKDKEDKLWDLSEELVGETFYL